MPRVAKSVPCDLTGPHQSAALQRPASRVAFFSSDMTHCGELEREDWSWVRKIGVEEGCVDNKITKPHKYCPPRDPPKVINTDFAVGAQQVVRMADRVHFEVHRGAHLAVARKRGVVRCNSMWTSAPSE